MGVESVPLREGRGEMKIACLQFAPQVGDVDHNLNRADKILDRVDPEDLDLLVLPELAFSGYNFKSLHDISQFLELSTSGISSLWSRTTALKFDCTVVVGYPEKVDPLLQWPTNPEYYSAATVVNGEGETVANYRKTHLYYTDETWALEGPAGFFDGWLERLGQTAIGICMDLNPYKFEAPWDDFEFAHHVLDSGATLVVIPMAWIANDGPQNFSCLPQEPDMDTLLYWVSRFEPIIRADSPEEVIIVFANRTGSEGDATYTGTSAVIGIQSGEVLVYGILGRGDKKLLIVDTESAPCAKLVLRPADYGTDPETPCMSGYDRHHESQLGFDSATTSLVGRVTSKAGPTRPPLTLSDSHFTHPDEENSSNSAEKEKRCSIRSDVSVWNNHQGRPSSHANQTTLTPERSLQQTDFETSGPKSVSAHPSGTNTCSLFPGRPSLPSSRHASRSRGPGRSDSAARKRADLDTACHRLESITIRSEIARDQSVSVNALHHHSTSASGYQASRSRSASTPTKLDGRAN